MLGMGADRDLPTVLLIDDDMISREVIATLLTLNGYTLHTAESGAPSLLMLEQGTCVPQVILVDVQMPGISGRRLIEELRARSRATIYAISARQPDQDVREAADGFLQKPFGPEALQRLLQDHAAGAATPPLETDEPVLSSEVLAQFRQMMPEHTVREVYDAVAADLHKRNAVLEQAIARKDANEVRRVGHAIKGGCGMAGARQAAGIGGRFEQESDQLNNSAALLGELQVALERLERMLEVEFPRQAT
ncbi:MAG TPA: response regulator [Terracidiphilus sp.]|nr:response regulator [Terracidiphilus sp.]